MASLQDSYHPFDAWIDAQGKTREWAATRLETTEASLSRIINGKQWPGREFFERLESITKGQVTAEHFVNPTKQVKPRSLPSSTGASAASARTTMRVEIEGDLLAAAAALGLDVGALADAALREGVRRAKIERWQADHADVIAWYNDHIEKDGVFGEEWRTF
jgi:antitoxin CcdA